MDRHFKLHAEAHLFREVAELSTLYEISKTLSQSLNLRDSLDRAFRFLAKNMGLARVVLVLYDEEKQLLTHYHSIGLTQDEQKRAVYRKGEGITGKVFQSGEPEVIFDIRKESRFLDRTKTRTHENKPISFICVPVTVKNTTIGVLYVDRVKGLHPELKEDARLLTIVASLVGQTVYLFRRMEKTIALLKQEKEVLQAELKERFSFPNLVGATPVMKRVLALVRKVAPVDATVLLQGESGTGKQLLAHILHYHSPRKEKPLVEVDCGTIPSHLIESELFGFVKGAFTGANFSRKGKLEEAHTGTVFLDEIGNLPMESQAKILRFLQEKIIYRLGSNQPIQLDVRVIAATNEDLYRRVQDGTFRKDLFHRLNVFPISVPPLRERKEDIPLLVRTFIKQNKVDLKKDVFISDEALKALMNYDYPGNVRELENTVLRLCILKEEGGTIEKDDVLEVLPHQNAGSQDLEQGIKRATKAAEKEAILKALEQAGQVKSRAAQLLGISDRALRYKLRKLGIDQAKKT